MSTAELLEVKDLQTEELRNRLIHVSALGMIKYTKKFLKKASLEQLLKIEYEYEKMFSEAIDKVVSKDIVFVVSALTETFSYLSEFHYMFGITLKALRGVLTTIDDEINEYYRVPRGERPTD